MKGRKLPVGETRPPMRGGVPHTYLIIILTSFTLNIILAQTWAMLMIGFAVIGIAYALLIVMVRRDYNAVRRFVYWCRTKLVAFDCQRWGGSSPSPLPIHARTGHRPWWQFWPSHPFVHAFRGIPG